MQKPARLAALTAFLLALAACGAEPPPPAERAAAPVFPVGRCINVANALNAPREGDWTYVIEAEHFAIIAEAGFDTVRIPMAWSAHVVSEAPLAIAEGFFARVDDVIGQALDAGLNVIIDVHNYDEIHENPAAHGPRLAAIWRLIGARYADLPDARVFFEILNEPRGALDEAAWEDVLAPALAAIRETNPTRAVIIGGAHWNSVYGLSRLTPPADPNLIATIHYYEPHAFTHQGADFGEAPPPAGRDWGTRRERAQLEADFDEAQSWGARHGMPVFLGEFGVFRAASMTARAEWMRAAREAAEARGMAWCAFDFAASFIMYDLETQRWEPALMDALGMDASRSAAP